MQTEEVNEHSGTVPVFIRRQSPDWWSLSRDYRAGNFIAASRYVPNQHIPGFPSDLEKLIAAWNSRFAIDFFTCRGVLANYSRKSISEVKYSLAINDHEIESISERVHSQQFFLFFHDDDDLFSPTLTSVITGVNPAQWDTIVFPLFRAGANNFTFVRAGCDAEFVWNRRENFHFRFQTNNYGLSSTHCKPAILNAMKDHIHASQFANDQGMNELVLPEVISATIKTPLSASILQALFSEPESIDSHIRECIEIFSNPNLPSMYGWLTEPLSGVASLLKSINSGAGYETLPYIDGESKLDSN